MLKRIYPQPILRRTDYTERQREIIQSIYEGLSNEDISKELEVSINTVRTHLRRIFAKAHVTTRTQLIVKLVRSGYFGCIGSCAHHRKRLDNEGA